MWAAAGTTDGDQVQTIVVKSDLGSATGTCVVITVAGKDPQSAECQSTVRLGRGTLQVDGLDHLKEPQTFAIVGGTGRYRDARRGVRCRRRGERRRRPLRDPAVGAPVT